MTIHKWWFELFGDEQLAINNLYTTEQWQTGYECMLDSKLNHQIVNLINSDITNEIISQRRSLFE